MTSLIPFNRPTVVGTEQAYIAQALASGHLAGDGEFTRRCNALLEQALGAPKVMLTTSCTHALEMAALLLNIQPGDEVIIPAFTFVTSINAFVLRGAKPVFADVRPDTLNIDESLLEALITPRTKALIVVHYAGISAELDSIMTIARRHGLAVVEDNAHGLFASYHGQPLGTFGVLATQSFHETKNFTSGEGGALVINDPNLIERAEIIRKKGTNRSRFFRGQVDKYTWVDLGSSYLPSELLAAHLWAQLEARQHVQAMRQVIWDNYGRHLADWASHNSVQLPHVPPGCEQPYHLFYLLMPSLADRQRFIAYLKSHQIQSVFHYLPLHLSPMGLEFGGRAGLCPVTESVSDRLVRLPFYTNLTTAEQAQVIEAVLAFR